MRRAWWCGLLLLLLWWPPLITQGRLTPLATDFTELLRWVPEEADFAIAVARPGAVADTLRDLLESERLRELPAYREASEQVNVRRFLQLLRYAERELGKPWRELVDVLAGGGIVLAGKYAPSPAPLLLIVYGRDAALLQQGVRIFSDVTEQELARRDLPSQRREHQRSGLKITQLGEVYYTVQGTRLLLSNRLEVFDYAAPLLAGNGERSLANAAKWQGARRSIPPEAVAWAWVDLRPLKSLPQVRQAVELPGDVPLAHVFFGRYLDLFRRADYLTTWLTLQRQELHLTLYVPAGWKEASPAAGAQTPTDGRVQLRPPLCVPGTIYTSSFYFDPASFLQQRDKLLRPEQRQAFEEFDKNSSKFLLGTRFSELVSGLGSRHRLIVAQPDRQTYSQRPGTILPSFALVLELKDAEKTGTKLAAILRAAALLASFQTRLELGEENHNGVKLVGYRFAEKDTNRAVRNGLLFNFSPCFAQVGDQFVLASTLELGRQIIRALLSEKLPAADSPDKEGRLTQTAAVPLFTDVFSWSGVATLLQGSEEQLVVQYVLERAQSLESARKQARQVTELVRSLGQIELRLRMADEQTRLQLHWQLAP